MLLLICLYRYKLKQNDKFLHMLVMQRWEREVKNNPEAFDRIREQGMRVWRKTMKQQGKQASTSLLFGDFIPFLVCLAMEDFCCLGRRRTARKEGAIHNLFRDPDPTRALLVHSRNKPGFYFPQDYLKILLYCLINFNVNYIATDLQLVLPKLRDPNQLLHFALRYPSFKTINVLGVHNEPGQKKKNYTLNKIKVLLL